MAWTFCSSSGNGVSPSCRGNIGLPRSMAIAISAMHHAEHGYLRLQTAIST